MKNTYAKQDQTIQAVPLPSAHSKTFTRRSTHPGWQKRIESFINLYAGINRDFLDRK